MKRRKFISATGGAVSIPILLNGMPVNAISKSSLFNFVNNETDRVLVLIQLNGGNDGLSTLVPIDQYDHLANARANILIPENQLIPVTDTLSFHPNMTGLKAVYDNARLGIIQGVGYPNQNRSHFRSTDIWTSGSPADEVWNTGWLGRYFQDLYPAFPEGYPNDTFPDPFAITMGSIVSETCQGTAANFSLTLNDPFSLSSLAEGEPGELPDTPYGEELAFLRTTIAQTNAYAGTITEAAEAGNNVVEYPENNTIAQQLKNVALLIAGGLKTKVYIVSQGGYDTHANQVLDGDPTAGEHADLLLQLSDAIESFQNDLQALGLEERVVGMTFSEFGRRIRSNDSFGTDHGTAAPLMLFGACVEPQIMGDNPEIPAEADIQEGVPMQYDFRDIYGSILMDWFEAEESKVQEILHDSFQYIPLLNSCLVSSTTDHPVITEVIETYNYPNPFQNWTTIVFESAQEWVKLSVFDVLGHEVKVLTNQQFPAGKHEIRFDATQLPPGNYYYRLQMEGRQKTKSMVKI